MDQSAVVPLKKIAPANRLDAEGNPTKNHDYRHDFGPGSLWRNAKTEELFVCGDAAANAARWFKISLGPLAEVALSGHYNSLKGIPRLGDAAGRNVGKSRDTVAAGDDARLEGAVQKDKNLADLKETDKALRNLGISPYVIGLLRAKDKKAFLKELGFEYLLDEAALNDRFQPKSKRLEELAGTRKGIIDALMGIEGVPELLGVLGLVVGTHVQRWSEALDRLKTISEEGLDIVTAPNKGAILSQLGIVPGKSFVEAHEVREELRQIKLMIGDLEARLAKPARIGAKT